ncbi:MAG TPA: hypothetical protein VKJ45_03285, partial [Blastocatellia bacterium]|nr:hypothetical protein [Blastocatellia bacterium]
MKRSAFLLTTAFIFAAAPVVWRGGAASGPAAPTFAKDVAPIIFNKCATCHRPGETAPMSLTSYQEVRPWSRDISEQVASHAMPPWFAGPASSLKFRNDRRLSQNEIDTIVAWVNAGCPKGDDKDLPPLPKFAQGWTL